MRELTHVQAPIAPVKLAHVVLRTSRLQEMADWYQTVLNAKVVFQNPMSVGLTFDEEHHRIALIAVPEPPAPAAPVGQVAASKMLQGADVDLGAQGFVAAPGLEHIAFTFGSFDELLSTYARLKAEGIVPTFCVNHGTTTSMYYADPQGNRIELQVDNLTMDQADDFMKSEGFLRNPVGYPYDPEALLQMFRTGRPLSEIAMNGWH